MRALVNPVCRSRPFYDGYACLNGCLGKSARFFALLCDAACYFGIFVILNGVRYAQIKEINDKASNKNTSTIERTTKRYKRPFFSPKVKFLYA